MLKIGVGQIDITPEVGGWMDGMHRSHESTGIHDRLHARAVAFDDGQTKAIIVSCEIICLSNEMADNVRATAEKQTGVPSKNIFLACSHTHSGPATVGYFNPADMKYLETLSRKLPKVIKEAAKKLQPAKIGIGHGKEETVSHYRRLKTKDGKIVMNWEQFEPENIVAPAGEPDHEVGVMKIVAAEDEDKVLATVFHYTTHPNVMSGENFMISGDFPGLASVIVEKESGGSALFLNGAQGSSDIDGLKDRDWEGVDRTGKALAEAVLKTAEDIREFQDEVKIVTGVRHIEVPMRNVSDKEVGWAKKVLAESKGEAITLVDGVTDEFKAELIMELLPKRGQQMPLQLDGLAVGDMAFVSFPGELFTEIGQRIKEASPFKQTYIMGLTNGNKGYFPSTKAIAEGGYSVDTRRVDPPTEEIITEAAVDLLKELFGMIRKKNQLESDN